jgi:3'-phosphoadenosine 5'-phosphosulfate sulfotransferase (PAPS reductase)/FAD synthetase
MTTEGRGKGEAAEKEIVARLKGRRVVASVSGGKDSAAMSLYLTELGIEHDRVFCDTGWEHPDTYAYLRGPLTEKLGPIVELMPKKQMVELVKSKGIFPSSFRRFCTQELKVYPLAKYINGRMDGGEDIVNAVGIRAAESESRSKMPEWEWQEGFDCEVWRPLLHWTEQEVIDIHTRHGLRPNPLYLRGASRVGCYPCILSRKDEIRQVADADPWRIDEIRTLEAEVAQKARERHAKAGIEHTTDPTFFQAKTGGTGLCWPIDRVVGWSRTARGGKQLELFAAKSSDAGCMRWGLCDTGAEADKDAES